MSRAVAIFALLLSALRAARRYVGSVMGEDAYDHYLRHHVASGCRSEPLSAREFWRRKMDVDDERPQSRCC